MTEVSFEHIHLRSPDPEATATFYAEMFGAEVIRSAPGGKPRIDLNLGGQAIFIAAVAPGDKTAPPPEPPYQGLDHIGLRVIDLDATVSELKSKGARFTMEPTTIRPGVRIAFMRGPENVSIELLQRDA
ncbi:MAG: VOC family protein [Gammaproteobacteria bacterium]|nr:VOC family protein [Gammaproteobacteria bacterium]